MTKMTGIFKKAAFNGRGKGAAILAGVFLVLFCTAGAFASGPQRGQTLRFGMETDFPGFDVLKSATRMTLSGSIAANTIMEPLFRLDAHDNLVPVLGLSATPSKDGKSWVVRLRKGVKFHDGTPFNADAVVYIWKRILNPANHFGARAFISPIVDVVLMDEYTVRFELKHPWLPIKAILGGSRGLGSLIPSKAAVEAGTQDRAPVGTGPFKFAGWQAGDSFTVVRNPDYWQKGLPYLDKIVFKPMPDPQTRFAGLKSGQLDMIWTDTGRIIAEAKHDAALAVYTEETSGAGIFLLNTSKPPLNDVNVRRALAHAYNQAYEVKMVYGNDIPVVHTPFGNRLQCADDGYREYNPAKARKLLSTYGKPVAIDILSTRTTKGKDIGELAQRLFKEVGVTATPSNYDFGPMIKRVLTGNYQMSVWRLHPHIDQGPTLFFHLYSKSRGNYSHYSNPEMDRLLVAQRMEANPKKRNKLLCDIARLINKDVPIIYRGGMSSNFLAKRKIMGISVQKSGIVRLDSVWLKQ